MLNHLRFAACMLGVCCATSLGAQEIIDLDNIDFMLEEKMLDEAANRYSSVLLSFLPEEASRLGLSSANSRLNVRSPQQNAQLLSALKLVRESAEKVDPKKLSPAKQTDREILLSQLDTAIWQAEQNPARTNPLYYTQPLDATYDLITQPMTSPARQRQDLTARLVALADTADQAAQYLQAPSPFLAQLAMEKAYHAYLSADAWSEVLKKDAPDEEAIEQANRTVLFAKQAVKKLFDLFKQFSQQESTTDFRLGEPDYFRLLQARYQLGTQQKPAAFLKTLEQTVLDAQTALTLALDPFLQQAAEAEEVMVIDESDPAKANALPITISRPVKQDKKTKKADFSLRNAQDFYAAAQPILSAPIDPAPLQTLVQDITHAVDFLINQGALKKQKTAFTISRLPAYYAYSKAYLFQPPFGNQPTAHASFLLRIPSGNKLNQQEQFNQDFNPPTRKIMISGELVPGRYYQMQNSSTDYLRQLYPSESLQNGWTLYAKRLAKEKGYLSLDDDLLLLAWDEYLHALAAWVDSQLHTKHYSYEDAFNFLTQTHGLNEQQATGMLKEIASHPGQAASYFIGLNALENAYKKFQKKQGKKFDEADFNAQLLTVGNVPPSRLEKELELLYKKH